MSKGGEKPIEIEPLSKEEMKAAGIVSHDVTENPEFPKEWANKDLPTLVAKGFKYYKRTLKDGRVYMVLRHKRKDKGLGLWNEEKEGKLFHFFPNLGTYAGIAKPPPWMPQASSTTGRTFLGASVQRTALIPREYVPTLNVIRYFQILKENGYPLTFSDFINDVVTHHFEKCNGIKLPIMLDIEIRREDEFGGEETIESTSTD